MNSILRKTIYKCIETSDLDPNPNTIPRSKALYNAYVNKILTKHASGWLRQALESLTRQTLKQV